MISVREALRVDTPTSQLFATPSIAGLAEALARSAASSSGQPSIPLAGYTAKQLAAGVPCSLNQEQMLVLHQLRPDSAAYNVHDAAWLHGDVAEDVLEAALTALACRQSSMRTQFVEDDGRVLQAVLPEDDPRAVVRLHRRSLPAGSALQAELARLVAQPYALVGGGVPLRIYLLAGQGARVLLLSAHHAIRCSTSVPGNGGLHVNGHAGVGHAVADSTLNSKAIRSLLGCISS